MAEESLVRSLSLRGVSHREESLGARSLSSEESLGARSLSARGVSRRKESPCREEGGRHNNQNVREVRGEEEDGCGGGRDGGQGAGDNNEVKIPKEVTGGRLVARRAGDTTIKCEGGEGRGGRWLRSLS